MARIFQLWVEAKDEANLQTLKAHFRTLQHTLLSGKALRFAADIENNDMKGLCVWSPQICGNGRGIETLIDALEATETGIFLFHQLMKAPDFRFAEVGWDVENNSSLEVTEEVKALEDGRNLWVGRGGCVFNDELFGELGSPLNFYPFRQGYWWNRYWGETYDPLFSDDQKELQERCEQLLPNNFD